jgi:sugar phosphate isomerase/epimerase
MMNLQNKNNLGISTIYFYKEIVKKNITWQQIKDKLCQLGLSAVELNADIPIEWFKEIQKDVAENKIKILSLHNFCPSVENIPQGKYGFNVFSLTSADEQEHNLAIKYTLRTIDYAELVNSNIVVLHLGEIETQPSATEVYKTALEYGLTSEIYQKYKQSLLLSREKNKQKFFSLLKKTLDNILPYAENKKVNLCIETRFFPNEIPNFEEFAEIFSYYKSSYLHYWHDFGHVEIQTNFGFAEGHEKFFNTYGNYLLGYHIHGVKNFVDHYIPSPEAQPDYKELLKYQKDKIYVLEIHPKESFNNLIEGVKYTKLLLDGEQK